MQYKQIGEVITKINGVLGKQETKVQKKLFKFAEKLKPYQDEFMEKLEELRLDNAKYLQQLQILLNLHHCDSRQNCELLGCKESRHR